MAFLLHKLRAAGPIFANLAAKRGSTPAAAVLRADGKERHILAVKLHPSVNVCPDVVRREFIRNTLSKQLPFPETNNSDFAGKFTLTYALSDVAILFAGILMCFWSSGWVKVKQTSAEGSVEGSALVSSPETEVWVFSKARERTLSTIASKIDFASSLANEEATRKLIALLEKVDPVVSDLKSNNEVLLQKMKELLKTLEAFLTEIKTSSKRGDNRGGEM